MRPILDNNIPSPFKFLHPYGKDDRDLYFGRKKETLNLFELYKDSSLIVLHGPSGSGKTSLIYCGLHNKINIKKENIISIRRDSDITEAIKKQLFTPEKQELLSSFIKAQGELKKVSKAIEIVDEFTLQLEDELVKLKRKRRNLELQKNNNEEQLLVEEIDDPESLIKEKEEKLQKNINQRTVLIKTLTDNHEKVNTTSSNISIYFKEKNANLPYVPLVIFDQFEELFVYGSNREIKEFGLFLKLIFQYKISLNIIISLREEYFGYLDQLQSYIPNIFYKKIRLAHPNELNIKEIIRKSFEKFNINQYKDHSQIENREALLPEEKERRIALIIDQIKIQEDSESDTSQKEGTDSEKQGKNNSKTIFHLPFLQVYLDRLYKMDYYNTYKNAVPKAFKKVYGDYPPLEFKENEIKEFGSIENVLDNYIREVNDKIIRNTVNKLNNRKQHEDAIVKFLRHFKTRNDFKKRISISENGGIYKINQKKIANKIQEDIWGEVNEKEYHTTLSDIIRELKDNGILTITNGYLELSHDIIAKVIGKMRIAEDFKSLIKKGFDSSFDIYEGTKQKEGLLSPQKITRIQQYKSYIIADENDEILLRKQQFFEESIKENEKAARDKELQNAKIKKYFNYSRIISALMLILLITLAIYYVRLKSVNDDLYNKHIHLNEVKKDKEQQVLINKMSGDIYKGTGDAFRDYKVDKTSSFNQIRKSESSFLSNLKLFGNKKFDLLGNFKSDFYKDYIKTPFYFNSILLGEGHIISTKTRKPKDNDSILYLYALTESHKLIVNALLYKQKNAPKQELFRKENSVAYEPFKNEDGKLMTLVAQKTPENNGYWLKLFNEKGNPYIPTEEKNKIFIKGKNLSDIEHQGGYSFLIGVDNQILKLQMFKNGNHSIQPASEIGILKGTVRRIKTIPNSKNNYLVLYGENKLFANYNGIYKNILRNVPLKDEVINSFSFLNKNSIALGLNGSIIKFNLKTKRYEKLDFRHEERISTIDVSGAGEILVGSYDKTASLWSTDNRKLKHFIGHTDAIRNVSFIKDDHDYIITSGEDQTIKIWNISPIAIASNNLNSKITHIQNEFPNKVWIQYDSENNPKKQLLGDNLEERISDSSMEIVTIIDRVKNIFSLDVIENQELVFTNTTNDMGTTITIDDINDIKYNTTNKLVAIACKDHNVYVCNENREVIQTITNHTDKVNAIDFSADGEYMVSASSDNKAILWEIDENNTLKLRQILRAHTSDVITTSFYGNQLFLTASNDNTAQIYRKEKNTFIQIPSLIRHDFGISAATFSHDGNYILTGDTKGQLKKWDFCNFDIQIQKRTIDSNVVNGSN